jgi:hypothetical protein
MKWFGMAIHLDLVFSAFADVIFAVNIGRRLLRVL